MGCKGALLAPLALMGCVEVLPAPVDGVDTDVTPNEYLGVETALLDSDLVQFRVAMRGADTSEELQAYTDCAAAQYAAIRDFGFARRVRLASEVQGGISRADAVYTISQDEPAGVNLIDAGLMLQVCAFEGIPTV